MFGTKLGGVCCFGCVLQKVSGCWFLACDNAFAKVSRHTACLFHQQSPILYRGRAGAAALNVYIAYMDPMGYQYLSMFIQKNCACIIFIHQLRQCRQRYPLCQCGLRRDKQQMQCDHDIRLAAKGHWMVGVLEWVGPIGLLATRCYE